MDKTFLDYQNDSLIWLPERGMGYYPVKEQPYDSAYFEKYAGYASTEMGRAITQARVDLVNKYLPSELVLDVGIGCGSFIDARANTYGYDINKAGIEWLKDRNLFLDPAEKTVTGLTFWDVLEHIHEPDFILSRAEQYIFASLPIFTHVGHVRTSKHYRKDEHCWYFTVWGFQYFMAAKGWKCIEQNNNETILGREDILTFVFSKV